AARQKRTVYHPRARPDGMASMTAALPAADAVAVDLTLESAARAAKHAGDGRTIDQLRADAFSLMAYGALANGYIGVLPEQQLAPSAAAETDDGAGGAAEPTGAVADVPARRAADRPPGSEGPRVPADDSAPESEGPGLPAGAKAAPGAKRAGRGKGTEVPYGAAPPVPGQRLPGGR